PTRSLASRTDTSTPARCRYHAVASPAMPPPTTTTTRCGSDTFEHGTGDGGRKARVVVQRLGAGEGDPELLGASGGLHVEVVEDLEVVGGEAGRAHEHACRPLRSQVVEHLSDVGPDPRLRCAPRALPADMPALDAGACRHRFCGLAQLL